MTQMTHQSESSGTALALYMAIELSATKWHLAFGVGVGTPVRHRVIEAGDVKRLQEEMRRARQRFGLRAEATVRSCYEAGRDGFWVHRLLTREGIDNRVIDSSSIEVNRRAKQAKTDRLDGTKLVRLLMRFWTGDVAVWKVVHVPDDALEDVRHQERGMATLTVERTTWRNRLHALLMLQGIRTTITADFGTRIRRLRTWAGAPLPDGLRERVEQAWRMLQAVDAELKRARRAQRAELAAAASPPARQAAQLLRVVGVGPGTATVLAKELFSRDLRNRREVGALTGLVGVPYASGAYVREQGISRAGLARVRRVAVELAWAWRRYQPMSALTGWFEQRFGAGGKRARKVGIVALARRVVVALWRYVTAGIVPAGAIVR
jgi:transposase